MSNELPLAVVTVRFDKQLVSGIQLAALVQQITGQNEGTGVMFAVKYRFYDDDIISFGQASGRYPYDNIRVVPLLDGLPFFRPEESYSEIKVTSHSPWDNSYLYAGVRWDRESFINAVKQSATELTSAYETALIDGSFPEYVEPKDREAFDQV